MTITTRLEKFDIETLDLYEFHQYYQRIDLGFSKTESLQFIIDGTDDLYNLSDNLQEIAIEQINEI